MQGLCENSSFAPWELGPFCLPLRAHPFRYKSVVPPELNIPFCLPPSAEALGYYRAPLRGSEVGVVFHLGRSLYRIFPTAEIGRETTGNPGDYPLLPSVTWRTEPDGGFQRIFVAKRFGAGLKQLLAISF